MITNINPGLINTAGVNKTRGGNCNKHSEIHYFKPQHGSTCLISLMRISEFKIQI